MAGLISRALSLASPLLPLLLLLLPLHAILADGTAPPPPFYGASGLNHTTAPRGWNSFVLQSNGRHLVAGLVDNQCSLFYNSTNPDLIDPNFDYVCSLDSGWSVGGNGDEHGRIIPDPTVFEGMSIQKLAAKLHANGMKLGVYVIPGAFTADKDKIVEGTNRTIGSLFNTTVDGRAGISNEYNARNDFDYSLDGVQQWHDSVIRLFATWGVDFIKLDYVTPGSSLGDQSSTKPANSSMAAALFGRAIREYAPHMRLDLSWRLDRDPITLFELWQGSADTIRLDQDINFSTDPVSWGTVQRVLETYRVFITQQVLDPARQGSPIRIRPDLDNWMGLTPAQAQGGSGLTTVQRYAQTILWTGAGANMITGCDTSLVDDLGRLFLGSTLLRSVAGLTADFPMVPRNPATHGGPEAAQLQAWVAGPGSGALDGTAAVILSNLGPDQCSGGCSFGTQTSGDQLVTAAVATDLGLGEAGDQWRVVRVLGGGGRGGEDGTDLGVAQGSGQLQSWLSEGESVLYMLTKCGATGYAAC